MNDSSEKYRYLGNSHLSRFRNLAFPVIPSSIKLALTISKTEMSEEQSQQEQPQQEQIVRFMLKFSFHQFIEAN